MRAVFLFYDTKVLDPNEVVMIGHDVNQTGLKMIDAPEQGPMTAVCSGNPCYETLAHNHGVFLVKQGPLQALASTLLKRCKVYRMKPHVFQRWQDRPHRL